MHVVVLLFRLFFGKGLLLRARSQNCGFFQISWFYGIFHVCRADGLYQKDMLSWFVDFDSAFANKNLP